jgi:hypothetical protein
LGISDSWRKVGRGKRKWERGGMGRGRGRGEHNRLRQKMKNNIT